jgi:hypothetical protein
MAKWARVVNGEVVEVTNADPAGRFHPSLSWTPCPNTVKPGWMVAGASYTAPVLALDQAQQIMRDAIKGREAQRNDRRIEHPTLTGSFFMPSERINKILSRAVDLVNADPIPTTAGALDDVNEVPVPMTVGQLKKLRDAFIDREEANYENRKRHIKAMLLEPDPLVYDYSGGWK